MNTTELIYIARECSGFSHEYRPAAICFYHEDFTRFTQRIEHPHLQRIAELEQELHYAKQAARVEADMYDQARAAMKQLREALSELADLMDDVRTGDYRPDSFTTQPARIALEQTK